jgi:SAM-dependent methyltransferase
MTGGDDVVLAEQLAYYRARAGEYDEVYEQREDLRALLSAAGDLPVTGDVLELACGTGQWTRVLAPRARSLTAVDAVDEALEVARSRTPPGVRFVRADVFGWRPPRRYDTVFFAFWLSHVPPARFAAFWRTVADALAPGGQAVFVDNGPGEAAAEDRLPGRDVPVVRRRLNDGSRYRVVKVFHDPGTLTADLAALGWSARIRPLGGAFIAGVARPPAGAGPGGRSGVPGDVTPSG